MQYKGGAGNYRTDVVITGSGIAGLRAAVEVKRHYRDKLNLVLLVRFSL